MTHVDRQLRIVVSLGIITILGGLAGVGSGSPIVSKLEASRVKGSFLCTTNVTQVNVCTSPSSCAGQAPDCAGSCDGACMNNETWHTTGSGSNLNYNFNQNINCGNQVKAGTSTCQGTTTCACTAGMDSGMVGSCGMKAQYKSCT